MCGAWRRFVTRTQLRINRDWIAVAAGRCMPMCQRWRHTMCQRWRHTIVAVAVVTPLFLVPLQFARSAAPPKAQLSARSVKPIPKDQLPARSVKASQKSSASSSLGIGSIPKAQLPTRSVKAIGISTLQPEPLRLPNTAIEPIDWNTLKGWEADDHAAAFATFLT